MNLFFLFLSQTVDICPSSDILSSRLRVLHMKKKNVINLIKYHVEKNEPAFREESYLIADSFLRMGDSQLAEYIMALLSGVNVFTPQEESFESDFLEKLPSSYSKLPLPKILANEIMGVAKAISYEAGISKFIFHGAPGTGKTESVKQLARLLNRQLYSVNFSHIVDSRLGQTAKNINQLFTEIRTKILAKSSIILFDELDALALDRTNANDIREMGRATSSILKELDALNSNIIIIATTNLFKHIDRALLRRFDAAINFNQYSTEDLQDVAEVIATEYHQKFKFTKKNSKFLRKIISLMNPVLMPGDLRNAIKVAFAFSDSDNPMDYLKQLHERICPTISIKELSQNGFTVREIEILTGISKSQISRMTNHKESNNE